VLPKGRQACGTEASLKELVAGCLGSCVWEITDPFQDCATWEMDSVVRQNVKMAPRAGSCFLLLPSKQEPFFEQ
jgi:hypothetical protein